MARVYVGNLDSCVTECDLEDEFRAFGIIRSVWVARRPSGYAFIDFDDHGDAQDAIRELNGKNGWRVELSHNSSGGRGGRSGGSDFKCYECGEPGHFARECHLHVGSQRCQSHTPRSRRSPSNGERFFTMAPSRRSPIPTRSSAAQIDSEEQNNRMVELENRMSELETLMAELIHCFDQIREPLLPLPQTEATASASAPKELDVGYNGRHVFNDGSYNAPDVEELNPVIPRIVAGRVDETSKRLAKLEEQLRLLERKKRRAKTEEKLRALQGLGVQEIEDLSYYAKFKVPETFKMPKFNNYNGSGNPKVHLEHFMMKMARYAENPPLMIRTFLESLTGPALQWFFMHRVHKLDTWEEVSDAFLRQYEFNMVFAPTRNDLVRAEKKRGESFRAYARRWHILAAQVCPALLDEEMTDLFLSSLPLEYFNKMIGSGCDTFANLVMVGERIEGVIRDGTLAA